jgi:hypothetical protein
MNKSTTENAVQWLFLDLNAFFASCEQQDNPALRGQPIIVVQTQTNSACAIAASYEAKRPRRHWPGTRSAAPATKGLRGTRDFPRVLAVPLPSGLENQAARERNQAQGTSYRCPLRPSFGRSGFLPLAALAGSP